MLQEILGMTYFNNTVKQYSISVFVFIGGIIVIKIINVILVRRLLAVSKRTDNTLDDFVIRNVENALLPVFYVAIIYYSLSNMLKLAPWLQKIVHVIFIAGITFFGIRLGTSIIKFSLTQYWSRKSEREVEDVQKNVRGISALVNIIVWSIGIIFLLDNLGFKISAVMAGLGIGGVAVALASQTILGDLFSYFVIFFDRPFQIGDFVNIDKEMGVIERIGIKTTRIKSLSGEQLVFSNTHLTNARIHNYKKMEQRRVAFTFGVVYHTGHDLLSGIPETVREIIESMDYTTFDRAHFYEYGDSSLNFEVVYYVEGADYNRYMDVQQSINLSIFKRFSEAGIEFAFPTRSVYIEKN